MKNVSIGIDFGTLSARGIMYDLSSGDVLFSYASEYQNKTIESQLPNSDIKLPKDWVLQDPKDYINSLDKILTEIGNNVTNEMKVISIGTTFTASTVLPLDKNNMPLSFDDNYKERIHAWPKLWKHHSAQKYADKINDLALKTEQEWLSDYGGKISSEWLFPKALQILEEDEIVYNQMSSFIEAGDWIVFMMTGSTTRSLTQAGFKGLYSNHDFPNSDFLFELNPKFVTFVEEKLGKTYKSPTSIAGNLKDAYMKLLRIDYTVPVSVSIIDAHAAVTSFPELKETGMYVSAGTSSCDIILNKNKYVTDGVAGIVGNGVLEGYYAYETGQAAVGDMFKWFIENLVPYHYYLEAEEKKVNIYQLLEEKIRDQNKRNDIVMLDWMNGNRTPFMNNHLKSIIHGIDLSTKSEDIYLAMMEASAFGKKIIVENYVKSGLYIDSIYLAGGLPQKSKLFNEIYSDVLEMDLMISEYNDNGAVGVAVVSAYASGYFATIEEAMCSIKKHTNVVKPNKHNFEYYNKKYKEYKKLFYKYGSKGS